MMGAGVAKDAPSQSSSNDGVKTPSSKFAEFTSDDIKTDTSQLTKANCRAIRKEIANLMQDHNHDDGSWSPLFIRPAWNVR